MAVSEITEKEKQRRQQVIASSIGSLAMEGQQLDALGNEISRRYIEGEISLEDFSRLMEEHTHALIASQSAGSNSVAA